MKFKSRPNWAVNSEKHLQKITEILRNVQCLLLELKDLTWQCHTAQLIQVTHRRPKLTFRESEDIIITFDEVERKPNFLAWLWS